MYFYISYYCCGTQKYDVFITLLKPFETNNVYYAMITRSCNVSMTPGEGGDLIRLKCRVTS